MQGKEGIQTGDKNNGPEEKRIQGDPVGCRGRAGAQDGIRFQGDDKII